MNIGTIAGLVNVRANIDTVICEVPKIETTKGGIVLPESAIHTAKPTTAKALLVGPFSNNRAAFKVEAGDTVHFQQHAGFEVEIGDSKYLVLAASQIILAVSAG